MKIYILLAHPDKDSFNGKIAEAYLQAAQAKGHEVRIQKLGEMEFDPILRLGYKAIQELEPDLKQAQENILWCEKWVVIYPIWWGALPALFKGFLDRTLLPGFAFKYHEKGPFWDKLLKGRQGEIISTCDAPSWWIRWQYWNSDLNGMKKATFEFCGISPVKVTRISGLRNADTAARDKWIQKIKNGVQ